MAGKVSTMDQETTAAQGLRITENVNSKYDAACKRLLSEKQFLARLMKAYIEEFKDYDVNYIAEHCIEGTPQVSEVPVMPDEDSSSNDGSNGDGSNGGSLINGMNTEDKTVYEGTITYDIRFRAIVPGTEERIELIINVEAQKDFHPGYPLIKRAIYYGCRGISSQYGREFTKSHYEKIKKVYSIWICSEPTQEWTNTVNRYRLTEANLLGEAKESVKNYDLMTIVMVCLGGEDEPVQPGEQNSYTGIIRMLDVLLSAETPLAEKRQILQDEFGVQMTQQIDEEMENMCNLSQGVMEKGIRKGRAEGRAEGVEKGIVKGHAKDIKSLMETLSLTVEQAMAALKVPENERQKYRDLLAQQP